MIVVHTCQIEYYYGMGTLHIICGEYQYNGDVCWVVCVWDNNNTCVVQEWVKKYYDASMALQNREALLDKVAEGIEKASIIHVHGSSQVGYESVAKFSLKTSTYWEPLPLRTSYSR